MKSIQFSLLHVRTLGLLTLSLLLFFLFFQIAQVESKKKEIKEEGMELSNVKYGLFNVDEWKIAFAEIISTKIQQFEIKADNKKQIKAEIERFLYKVITDFETRFYQENNGTLNGFLKNTVANFTGTFSKMKQSVPVFANQIIDFMGDKKNNKAVRNFLIQKMNEYASETFSETNYALQDSILKKYNFQDRNSAIAFLTNETEALEAKSTVYRNWLLLTSLTLLVLIVLSATVSTLEFLFLSFAALILLAIGLYYPMIEIDARISSLKFTLLGHPMEFSNQVLYYRSKSILEVVRVMFSQGDLGLVLIGSLIFLFSVLFPLSKIVTSLLLLFRPNLSRFTMVNFLVYKTGKWSMADVMVVAVFMAYVGFSGILSDQLKQLGGISDNLEIVTTNQSSLQIGFYSFFSFVLLSLFLTEKIRKKSLASMQIAN